MKIELEIPDEIASGIPEGYRLEYRKPLKGERFFNSCDTWETAVVNISCHRFTLTPKHTWPAGLKCAAISRNEHGYIAHILKPFTNSKGEWISDGVSFIIHGVYLTDPLPALEAGECLFNPNWQE